MSQRHRFLFLQGPHGPFFDRLARALRTAGHDTYRIALNNGDAAFWSWKPGLLPIHGAPDTWFASARNEIAARGITDIVLYGDARPFHASVLNHAQKSGLRCHVFEEGYLRPHWISYERGPSNGNSASLRKSIPEMDLALRNTIPRTRLPEARWGAMYRHVLWSAAYHASLLAGARKWPSYRSHRAIPVGEEAAIAARRILSRPLTAIPRNLKLRRFLRAGHPYHVVLLQLDHDLSRVKHGRFRMQTELVSEVLDGFSQSAPSHHHLVFKLHPLDDGRDRLQTTITEMSATLGVSSRVQVFDTSRLAPLLDSASSAITDTSTSAMQALWRGLPVLAFGQHVFVRPELTSNQSVSDFFLRPDAPDPTAERILRTYLLATSQVFGSFYTAEGRAELLRRLPDLMLDPLCPASRLDVATATPQLRAIVKR